MYNLHYVLKQKFTQYLEQIHGHVYIKIQQARNENKLTLVETKLKTDTHFCGYFSIDTYFWSSCPKYNEACGQKKN